MTHPTYVLILMYFIMTQLIKDPRISEHPAPNRVNQEAGTITIRPSGASDHV